MNEHVLKNGHQYGQEHVQLQRHGHEHVLNSINMAINMNMNKHMHVATDMNIEHTCAQEHENTSAHEHEHIPAHEHEHTCAYEHEHACAQDHEHERHLLGQGRTKSRTADSSAIIHFLLLHD